MRRASKGSIDLINILDSNIKPVRDLFFTMTRCDANNSSVTFESFLNKGSGWAAVDEWLYYISGHNGVAKFRIDELAMLIEELEEIKAQLEIRESLKR